MVVAVVAFMLQMFILQQNVVGVVKIKVAYCNFKPRVKDVIL